MPENYSLKQIKIAFSRYCKGGGELHFIYRDTYGSVEITWDGFLEELKKARDDREVV